jgi:hypothetical protein
VIEVAVRTRKKKEAAPVEVAFDEIAARAYEIHISGMGGDADDNWIRAEQQLRAERDAGMRQAA